MIRPYRTVVPKVSAWLPSSSPSGLDVALGLTLLGTAAALFASRGAAWASGAFATALVLLVLRGLIDPVVRGVRNGRRLRAMRRACRPERPAGPHDTVAEERLGRALADVGLAVHAQQALANDFGERFEYRTDLAFYDARLRIDIEVDGAHKDGNEGEHQRMARRDDWFTCRGWHLIRLRTRDCYHEPAACAAGVRWYVE